jgi:hypothetical protein
MKRRDFIRITASGLAVLAMGSGLGPIFRRSEAHAADAINFALDITEVQHEMVDGKLLYSWAYAVKEQINDETVQVPSLPGPTLFVRQGQAVNVTLTNTMSNRPSGEAHGFAIFSKNAVVFQSPPLAAGQTTQFTIPGTLAPGTYLYEDPVNRPVGRVLGLHGVLVVMPAATYQIYPDTAPPAPGFSPYGVLAAGHPVGELFSDLGQEAHFPGEPWLPSRQVIWVFSEIDPKFNEMAMTQLINPTVFERDFLPQYFTVNGRSGYFASEDHTHGTTHVHVDFNQPLSYILSSQMESALMGKVGQPILIRNVAAGLDTHSPHTHANHAYILAVDGNIQGLNLDANGFPVNGNPSNLGVWWVDTWTMLPEDRKDVLYPMITPPDIPAAENLPADLTAAELLVYDTWAKLKKGAWHPTDNPEGSQEMMALVPGQPPQDLNLAHPPGAPGEFTHMGFPMHSHQEISQCAAGGNYPMGQIVHIMFTGYVGDGHDH